MRLDTLTIKGVLAYGAETTLDTKDLPPGLIAVVGPNGSGKSALMEGFLACVYQRFASRSKKVFDYATGTDAFIESTFELEGRGLYRARLNIDGVHRKAEAALSHIEADGRVVALNDGKVSTYEAEIRKILPPMDDLLASVFAAQNRAGSFSALDRKGRRELFASLLGLDHLEQKATWCRAAVARLTQEIAKLSAARDLLARDAGADVESALDQRAQQLQIDGGSVESRRVELRRLIADAERDIATLQEAAASYASATDSARRLTAAIAAKSADHARTLTTSAHLQDEAAAERRRLVAAFTREIEDFQKKAESTVAFDREIAAIDARLTAAIDNAERLIAKNNDELIGRADEIRGAVQALEHLDVLIAANLAEATKAHSAIESHRVRESVLVDTLHVIGQREQDLRRAEQGAQRLTTAPFGDGCAPCEFMTDAAAAKARIPSLTEAVASKGVATEELARVRLTLTTAKATLDRLRVDSTRLADERVQKKALADKLPFLLAATERILALRKAQADATADAERARADAKARAESRLAEIQTEWRQRALDQDGTLVLFDQGMAQRAQDLAATAAAIHAEIVNLHAELDVANAAAGATADAAARMTTAQAKLTTYRAEWDQTTGTLAAVKAQVEYLAERRAALAVRRRELDAVEASVDALQTELIEWSRLAKAFGRDGLQPLEIDNAGPAVSAYCNHLLTDTPFTVDLITQDAKITKGKDGSTHKEVFDMKAYDSRRPGEVRDLTDLSGGEQVIVDEAFRCAIALLVNTRNVHPIRTMFRDETTGALNPENAERYVAMLRRVQEIGGFHHIFFVTHNPDCARLADAQVVVEGGTFTIALPPFVAALQEVA